MSGQARSSVSVRIKGIRSDRYHILDPDFPGHAFSAKYWMLLFINASETEIIHNAVLFILANSGFYIALVFVDAVRFTIQERDSAVWQSLQVSWK